MNLRRKVGRPKKEDSRSDSIKVRLNSDERDMLEYLTANGGESYSNVLRIALRNYYHLYRANED